MPPTKIYVAYKPCKMPHVICKLDSRPYVDLTEEVGVGYYEDEIGWYHIIGELRLDPE